MYVHLNYYFAALTGVGVLPTKHLFFVTRQSLMALLAVPPLIVLDSRFPNVVV
jgi:hypothetical protein